MRVWLVTKGLLLDNRAAVKPGQPGGQPADRQRGAPGSAQSRSRPGRLGLLRRPLVALTVLAAAGALAAGCGSSSGSGGGGIYGGGGPVSTGGGPADVATVTAARTKLGMVLVDGSGRTLYLFEKDQPNQSTCAGTCAAAWPVDHSSGTPKAGSGVQASLLGTINRSDNTTQVTYNGHPLYYYSGDSQAGQQNGQGLNTFGAAWYVVAPTGGKVG
jgi:predicted lipoprotein with Yx(FWY)xxD motif